MKTEVQIRREMAHLQERTESLSPDIPKADNSVLRDVFKIALRESVARHNMLGWVLKPLKNKKVK